MTEQRKGHTRRARVTIEVIERRAKALSDLGMHRRRLGITGKSMGAASGLGKFTTHWMERRPFETSEASIAKYRAILQEAITRFVALAASFGYDVSGEAAQAQAQGEGEGEGEGEAARRGK